MATGDRRALDAMFWALDEVAVDLRRGDDDDPLAGVVRLKAEGERDVDVVVGRAAWQTTLLSQNLVIDLEGARVPVVDAPGLILLKLYAGRNARSVGYRADACCGRPRGAHRRGGPAGGRPAC